MQKFIDFFKRFRVFIIFLFLQVIALSSYFSVVSFPRTRFFNSSSSVVAVLLNWERNITKYIHLEEANLRLQEENKRLQEKNPKNFISVDSKTKKVDNTLMELSYEYIQATVINSSFRYTNNYFTIAAGNKREIQRKMGVVSPQGVVGIIYDFSEHYALVKSILTSDINISAYDEDSQAFGIIKYEGDDPQRVKLTGISNDISLKKGSPILTMGSAGYFPKGIPIGIIEDFFPIEGKPLWDITVLLHQDMRKLNYVYVVKNIHQTELNELHNRIDLDE